MDVARRNFLAIFISHWVMAVGMAAFIPFIPFFLEDLAMTDPVARKIWSGLIIAAAPFTACLAGPFWGALSDRIGRKIMVLRSLLAITVFVGLMGLVTAPWQFLVLRALQGLFSGFVAAGNTLVSVSTPVERQARVLGLLQTALLMGFALGPLLGGGLGDLVGHRPVFLVTASLAALACGLVWILAREDRRADRAPRDRGRLARSVVRDLLDRVRQPGMRYLLASLVCFRTSLSMMIPVLPIYMVQIGGYDEALKSTMASFLYAAVAVPILLFITAWSRRADRAGPGHTFMVCTLLSGLGFLPYGLAWTAWALIVVRALQGVFLAGIMPSMYAATARLSPAAGRGAAMGLTQSALQFSMALGACLGGVLAAAMSLYLLFVICFLLMTAAAGLARFKWMKEGDV